MDLTRRALRGGGLAATATPAIAAPAVMRIGTTPRWSCSVRCVTTLGDEYIYDNLVFNGLTRMNADLPVGPDLAESWTSTEDLKQWTFTLRRGVKFHNGREMVADDVIAGFTRLLDPQSAAAPDPYTVRFNFSYAHSGLCRRRSPGQGRAARHGRSVFHQADRHRPLHVPELYAGRSTERPLWSAQRQ